MPVALSRSRPRIQKLLGSGSSPASASWRDSDFSVAPCLTLNSKGVWGRSRRNWTNRITQPAAASVTTKNNPRRLLSSRFMRAKRPSSAESAERDGPVGAAKPERVGQRDIDLHFSSAIGCVIQITSRVLVEDVDGGRRNLMMDRKHRENRLDGAGGSQKVPGHRFGRIHHQFVSVISK